MASEASKPMTKSEVMTTLAEGTGLSKKDIASVFEHLTALINKEIGKKGPGVFNLPGLIKIHVAKKEATKATTKENPFKKGEMMVVKAKPARRIVRVRALKALKDMA